MNPMDDRELNRLLRDLPTPANLKENLRLIPEQGSKQEVLRDSHVGYGSTIVWAASLAAAAALIFVLVRPQTRPPENVSPSPVQTASNEFVQQKIDDCLRRMEEINAELDLVIAESQLQSQRSAEQVSQSRLGRDDLHSLILAESSRAAMQFGLSTEAVKGELHAIQQRFPNTQGAAIAQRLLDRSEFN